MVTSTRPAHYVDSPSVQVWVSCVGCTSMDSEFDTFADVDVQGDVHTVPFDDVDVPGNVQVPSAGVDLGVPTACVGKEVPSLCRPCRP